VESVHEHTASRWADARPDMARMAKVFMVVCSARGRGGAVSNGGAKGDVRRSGDL
jgi:hypothetical protein